MFTVLEQRFMETVCHDLPRIADALEGINRSAKIIADHITEDTMPSDPQEPLTCEDEDLPF